MKYSPLPCLVALLVFAGGVAAEEISPKAKELFERYVALDQALDASIADLYADEAKIQNTRINPSGEKRTIIIPVDAYKKQIRTAMPLARITGEEAAYKEAHFTPEGERVRITCVRVSGPKKTSSPLSLLVGPGDDGKWLIFEELSESQSLR